MQPKDFEEELKQASDKINRGKKRRSGVEIPSPLTLVSSTKIASTIVRNSTPAALRSYLVHNLMPWLFCEITLADPGIF